MSDFDEEAERERLREQFERDKEKREASERMSELLLKGATMTNKHCDTCGDPVFRYEGQEFCPTCQQPTDQQPTDQQPTDQQQTSGERSPPAEQSPEQQPPEQSPEQQPPAQDPAPGDAAADRDSATAEQTPGRDAPEQSTGGDADGRAVDPAEHVDPSARRPPATQRDGARSADPDGPASRRGGPPSSAGGLAGARESLVRTITEMTEKAEVTDDPARKRDYLAAAREAAEALAATDRVD